LAATFATFVCTVQQDHGRTVTGCEIVQLDSLNLGGARIDYVIRGSSACASWATTKKNSANHEMQEYKV
jgi:hypothetical protein